MILKNEPLVSIVVPVYNATRFLDALLNSVLSQTYQNFELILIDDLSSDESALRIEAAAAKDKRIKLIRHSVNQGAPKARFTGTKEAKGKYLAFLDADDLWEPEKLSKQVKLMEEKNLLFTFTNYTFTDAQGNPQGEEVKMPPEITYTQALRRSPIFTSTTMFNIEKIKKSDLKMPEIKIGEDTLTWWNILKLYGPAQSIQETLACYRRSENTLSSNKIHAAICRWKMYRDFEKLSLFRTTFYFAEYVKFAIARRKK